MNNVVDIFDKIPQCRIAIIGDFTLDFYIKTNADFREISVETGLPTLPVTSYHTSPGGAGNVAVNLKTLGVQAIKAFGVIGNDIFGYELLQKLGSRDIEISGMVTQSVHWNTHVYIKIIEKGAEGNRIDFGNFNILDKKTADDLISKLEKIISETDVVIINQQSKAGIHTSYFRNLLVEFIKRHPDPLYITDSRDFPGVYSGTCRKINTEEAEKVLKQEKIELKGNSDRDKEVARELYTLWEHPVFITRGERGIMVSDHTGCHEIHGIQLTAKLDTVGAGDTSLAGISAAIGAGYSAVEAAALGNLAAAVSVQKLHTTGTATKEEILALEKEASYIYNPELAVNKAGAAYWQKTEIEIIRNPAASWNYRYALFDHDGTLSTLRQGWEQVMEPMMMESIIGKTPVDPDLYVKILHEVRDFIDKTTGIQTLIQMKGLISLVKEFGLIPEHKILDEFGYKEIYNGKLMEIVYKRIGKFKNGELNIQDVIIKNAFPFLKELKNKGATLFLVSGTDEEDVIQETELLGYRHLFDGGIFGATQDITKEPKRVVIHNIVKMIGQEKAKQILTFGDGPVEIAETKRAGGFTVGIASDEVKRYGLNSAKRTRLIRAGADLIIPDYSQMEDIYSLLEGNQEDNKGSR